MLKKLLLLILSFVLVSCAAPVQQNTKITLVTHDNFTYEPASITVPVSQPVSLTIKNEGGLEHDFVIEKISIKDMALEQASAIDSGHNGHDMTTTSYDLHLATLGGKTSAITFTPVSAGTYEFFCTVKGHKEAGMTGVLIVTD